MNWPLLFHDSVIFAAFGAFAIQLLSLIELKNVKKTERPDFKDILYWLPFIVSPILAGGIVLAYIYPTDTLSPLASINIGVSWPLILRSIAKNNPVDSGGIDPGEGA